MSTYHPERVPFPSPGRLRRELRLRRPPLWLVASLLALLVTGGGIVILLNQARHRVSQRPRIHLVQDMDIQPRYGPQSVSNVFADGRAMRAPVEGAIARGHLAGDDHYDRGYQLRPDPQTGQEAIAFFDTLPMQVKDDPGLADRGRKMFNIYCAGCHGVTGDGHGPINERAVVNQEPKWIPALSLLSQQVRDLPDGHLYNVIRSGIRNMPAHGSQIGTRDRWAIVSYLRQLQRQTPAAPTSQPVAAAPAPEATR